jgi:hypothetical protein
METMNTENNIDKMFKEGLEGQHKAPPSHLWNQIASNIPATPAAPNGNGKARKSLLWWSGSALLLLLVGTICALLYYHTPTIHHNPPVINTPVASEPDIQTPESTNLTDPSHPHIAPAKNHPAVSDPSMQEIMPTPLQSIPSIAQSEPIPSNPHVAYAHEIAASVPLPIQMTPVDTSHSAVVTLLEAPLEVNPDFSETHIAALVAIEPVPLHDNPIDTSLRNLPTPSGQSPQILKSMMTHTITGLTLHAGSQLYRSIPPFKPKTGAGFDGTLMAHAHLKRFSLHTGVGWSHFSEKSPWLATIRKTDTISYYQHITGLQFQPVYNPIDSSITGYQPVNITTISVPIIDTVTSTLTLEGKTKYTYLQVPLLLGYDLIHQGPYTLSLNGGVIWSFETHTSVPPPDPPGETIDHSMQNLGLIRKELYWQYHAGVMLRYEINRKWFAEGAAGWRIPHGSWYHQSGSGTKPMSLILSAGLGFWL